MSGTYQPNPNDTKPVPAALQGMAIVLVLAFLAILGINKLGGVPMPILGGGEHAAEAAH